MGLFTMPVLGADMERGTLVEWRVRPGDRVAKGELIAVVDTDKATIDVEVFESGVVEELLVQEGDTVPVGTPLARIDEPATVSGAAPVGTTGPAPRTGPAAAEHAGGVRTPDRPAAPSAIPAAPTAPHPRTSSPLVRHLADRSGIDLDRVEGTGPGGRVTREDVERAALQQSRRRVSPRARRLARERSVDVAAVTGSGPGGSTVARDVEAASTAASSPAAQLAAPPTGPADQRSAGRSGARAAAARSMERSQREIPHYHLRSTIDLEPALAALARHNSDRPPDAQVLPAALLLAAVAASARRVPEVNGWWTDGDLVTSPTVDLGMVVSLRDGGLVTPTIREADHLDLDALMAQLRDVVARCRSGRLRSSDLAPASLTVTNLGDRGADVVHGLIQHPQVALVGFGRIAARPHVVDGGVQARRTVVVSLAADHRASDGRIGSRFLHHVEQHLIDLGRSPVTGSQEDPT